jgi:hypothetical protein
MLFNVDAYNAAGVHRNLGSHISRVRSLHLDTWSQDTLALMAAVGNTASNRYLLHLHINCEEYQFCFRKSLEHLKKLKNGPVPNLLLELTKQVIKSQIHLVR